MRKSLWLFIVSFLMPSILWAQMNTGYDQGSGAGGTGTGTVASGTAKKIAVYSGPTTVGSASSLYFSAGNLGIGSASPGQVLDVTGNARVSGTVAAGAFTGNFTSGIWQGTPPTYQFGGTGQSTAPDDTLLLGSGSAWAITVLPNCLDTGGNHWNYDSSINTIFCGTSSSGGGGGGSGNVGSGTFSPNYIPAYVGIGTLGPTNMVHVLGNIGIGTIHPGTAFDVNGTARALEVDLNGSGQLTLLNPNGVGLGTTGTNFYLTTNGNIGIGTASPPNKLYVAGTAEMQAFKLPNNGVAAGYVLTSNATGIGTWMPSVGGAGGSSQWTTTGDDIYYTTGNVGIGTTLIQAALTTQAGLQINSTGTGNAIFNRIQGNMGVGTDNPVAKLSIVGNVGIGTMAGDSYVTTTPPTGGLIVYGNVGVGSTNPGQKLDLGTGAVRIGIGTTTNGTLLCIKSIGNSRGTIGYCTGSLTNSICGTCN